MITLVVSSSFGKLSCGIFRGEEPLFSYGPEKLFNSNLGRTVQEGLAAAGLTAQDLVRLVVDVGPGGTSAVRTGVAFINGLSYSLDLPVFAIASLESLAAQAGHSVGGESVCAVANSLGDTMYYGYPANDSFRVEYGATSEFFAAIQRQGITNICGDPAVIKKLTSQPDGEGLTGLEISAVEPATLLALAQAGKHESRRFPNLPIPLAELLAADTKA